MPNKKRIYNRIRKIEIKQFKKGISNFIAASKQATFASNHMVDAFKIMGAHANHMVDAFKYFTETIEKRKKLNSIVFQFETGIYLGSIRCFQKTIAEQVPAKYLNDFVKMVDVGFTEKDAFETLQETYKF